MSADVIAPSRVEYDELELDDELASLNGIPFTGIVYSLRADGSLESEGPYRDGLPDGVQEDWHPGGQIAQRWIAIRGRGSSESWSWYPNGQQRSYRRNDELGLAVELKAWNEQGEPVDPMTVHG